MKLRLPASIQFLACVLIWGGSWIAIQDAVAGADPIGVAALRTSLAFVILLALAFGMRLPWPGQTQALRALLIGTVFIGANFALVFWSAPRLPVGFASIAYSTTPLQAAILSPLLGVKDRFAKRSLVALAVAPLGVGLAFGNDGAISSLAALAVLLAATTSAGGTILARRWASIHPVWLNVLANLSGSAVLWAYYLGAGAGSAVPQGRPAWIAFAYLLFGGSVVAFLLYFSLVRKWDAARACFTTLTTPFVALAFGFVLRGERIQWADLLGALLILGAGSIVLWNRKRSAEVAPLVLGESARAQAGRVEPQ
jgi:probable blue pigment (indigoidine) exporter